MMCLTYKMSQSTKIIYSFYVFEINKVLDFSMKDLDHFSTYTLEIFRGTYLFLICKIKIYDFIY